MYLKLLSFGAQALLAHPARALGETAVNRRLRPMRFCTVGLNFRYGIEAGGSWVGARPRRRFWPRGSAGPLSHFSILITIFIVVLTRQGQGQIGSRDQVRSYKLVVMFGRRCAIDAKSCGMNTTMEVLLRSVLYS